VIEAIYLGESYKQAKKLGAPLIHWIPMLSRPPKSNQEHWILSLQAIQSEVVIPDGSIVKGFAEEACGELKPNEIVQFQRFGFVRVDETNEKLIVYFAHR
jgi:glutamyl-tRNA synthetase